MSFADFADVLNNAKPSEAAVYGSHEPQYPDKVSIVTKGKEKPDNVQLSRTKEYYRYPCGVGGILMFDHDPSPYGKTVTPTELIDLIDAIHPGFGGAARIVRGSVSSGVHKADESPRQGKGFHLYVPVKDASDIPRYGKTLFERVWLAKYGHIALSKCGSKLTRSVLDATVFSPERLDFIAAPIVVGDQLRYTPPEILYQPGGYLDTSTLTDLDESETAELSAIQDTARADIDLQSGELRTAWVSQKIEELISRGVPEAKAKSQIEQVASSGFRDLYGDFVLEFVTGAVTVSDVLLNPSAFNDKALADPIEGTSYGATTAKFYWNHGKPVVNSMAHGGCKYFLHDQPPIDETGSPSFYPSEFDRPCYRVADDFWMKGDEKKRPGVWHFTYKAGDEKTPPQMIDSWLCGPLHVEAKTRGKDHRAYGYYLRLLNTEKRWHTWAMPKTLLAGPPTDIIKELADRGLDFSIRHKHDIAAYINEQHPKKRLWSTDSVGWFDDGVFVLPGRVLGSDDEVIYRGNHGDKHYSTKGDLSEWREHVAALAPGNDFLTLSVSMAFAGSLLKPCNMDGSALHFFGPSSTGKSSSLKVSSSVWGNWAEYKKPWKTTANGLEGAATLFNDGLLCLDEIGDGEPKEIGDALYMLANGTGKNRATVTGGARVSHTWRLVVISNGEYSIEAHCAKKGIAIQPGQLVRFLQIPVEGKHGAFDELHGAKDGNTFSHTLTRHASKCYGTAGPAFLEQLVKADLDDVLDDFEACLHGFEDQFKDLEAQEIRAAKSFAVAAVAGELATQWQITGWTAGTATRAALNQFMHWRDNRGHGDLEPLRVCEAVKSYIETYGDARFTATTNDTRLHGERSGYWRKTDDGGKEWLFSRAGLSKALHGLDFKRALVMLESCGWLKPGNDRQTIKVKIAVDDGAGSWFYRIIVNEGFNHA